MSFVVSPIKRFASIGLNHQSNGRALPLSRSWNRVIAQWGLEKGDSMVLVRPWWRIHESTEKDDNPGIENYMGRGETVFPHRYGGHVVSIQARVAILGKATSPNQSTRHPSLPGGNAFIFRSC